MINNKVLRLAMATALVLAWPHMVPAQTCDLRLSDLEAATDDLQNTLEDVVGDLQDLFWRFGHLERRAGQEPESCPDGLADSRNAAMALTASDAATQGEILLSCGQFFVARVQADIDRATAANESQLVIRLSDIQRRILAVQQKATDLAVEATFLGLRQDRLVAEHDALSDRCAILGDIYD